MAYTKGKDQEEISDKFLYLQMFIYPDWKHEVSGSENRPIICSHTGLVANSQQATRWGPDVPCMYLARNTEKNSKMMDLRAWIEEAGTSVSPTLDMERETFVLQSQQIHSGVRRGRSLRFYNHLECKQLILGLSPLENEENMGLGRKRAFSVFVAGQYLFLRKVWTVREHWEIQGGLPPSNIHNICNQKRFPIQNF